MDKISSDDKEAKLISGRSLERASSSMSSESVIWKRTGSVSAALDFLRVMTQSRLGMSTVDDPEFLFGRRLQETMGLRPRADYVTEYR